MLHTVILAGGSGTRFWPASRRARPKQFLSLASPKPLLRLTFERVIPLAPVERTWVLTNRETADLTRRTLVELPPENVLAEPAGRDTAACVGLAAVRVLHTDPEAVCLVLPADHLVDEEDAFAAAMRAGAAHVEQHGGLLTFGVAPTHPETGYGYLEVGEEVGRVDGLKVHRLNRFVEKPDPDTAAAYVSSGRYLWNAGIFAWRAADLLAEVRRQLPVLAQGLDEIAAALGTPDEESTIERVYPTLPRTSVDFGIMESARRCWTLPVRFGWTDVGSWTALATALPADGRGNVVRGRVVTLDGNDNIVISEGPVTSLVGVSGMVVVATQDAVLVMTREAAQRVKDVVKALEERGWDDVL